MYEFLGILTYSWYKIIELVLMVLMNEEDNKKKGFWIRMWMEYGRGHSIIDEEYRFLLFEDGYESKDEEFLKEYVHDWAQYDKHGADRDYYKYGYDIVDKPPMEWLNKELKRLIECREELSQKIDFINGEMNPKSNSP